MQQARAHLLDVEPFEHAFGPKGKRKRPKLTALDYESLLKRADDSQGESWPLIVITIDQLSKVVQPILEDSNLFCSVDLLKLTPQLLV